MRDAAGLSGALKEAIRGGGPALIEVEVGQMPSPWGLLRLKSPGSGSGANANANANALPSPFAIDR